MNDPTQEEKPEDSGQDELDDGHKQAPLKQLPQAGDEEATERCYDVARRSLSCHSPSLYGDRPSNHCSLACTKQDATPTWIYVS
jgi:hypothetical protein